LENLVLDLQIFFPLVVFFFAFISFFNLIQRILNIFGIKQFIFNQSSLGSDENINDGKEILGRIRRDRIRKAKLDDRLEIGDENLSKLSEKTKNIINVSNKLLSSINAPIDGISSQASGITSALSGMITPDNISLRKHGMETPVSVTTASDISHSLYTVLESQQIPVSGSFGTNFMYKLPTNEANANSNTNSNNTDSNANANNSINNNMSKNDALSVDKTHEKTALKRRRFY